MLTLQAKTLLKALVRPEQIPSIPSSLNTLTQADLKSPFTLSPAPNREIEKPLAAKPVPAGHKPQIYREVVELAKTGIDPTPQQLTDLFRMMEFDSPGGEMKDEAFAIWQEMRSRGVIPTKEGYAALLKLAGQVGDVLIQEEIVHSLWGDKVPLTEIMTHHLIEGLFRNHEIDRAIFLFRDLRARGLRPRLRTFNLVISLCVDYVEPEEAFRMVIDLKETYGEESVADRHWWRVLELCAREGYVNQSPILR
jgi:pentatricopeptide repeat protein